MTKQDDSNNPPADPQRQTPRQPPVIRPAPPQGEVRPYPSETPDNQRDTAKELAREFRWVEVTSLIINGALAVIGVVALCIYHGQLTVMSGQLTEMQEARKQAKVDNASAISAQQMIAQSALTTSQENFAKSLKSSESQSRLDQRAWVGPTDSSVSEVKEETPVTFTITLTNSGKTPALRVRAKISSARFPDTVKFVPRYTKEKPSGGVGVIQPGGKIIIDQKTAPAAFVERIKDGAILYYVFGRVDYEDVFGKPHWTTYCFYIGGEPTLRLLFQCKAYNEVSKEQDAQR